MTGADRTRRERSRLLAASQRLRRRAGWAAAQRDAAIVRLNGLHSELATVTDELAALDLLAAADAAEAER